MHEKYIDIRKFLLQCWSSFNMKKQPVFLKPVTHNNLQTFVGSVHFKKKSWLNFLTLCSLDHLQSRHNIVLGWKQRQTSLNLEKMNPKLSAMSDTTRGKWGNMFSVIWMKRPGNTDLSLHQVIISWKSWLFETSTFQTEIFRNRAQTHRRKQEGVAPYIFLCSLNSPVLRYWTDSTDLLLSGRRKRDTQREEKKKRETRGEREEERR